MQQAHLKSIHPHTASGETQRDVIQDSGLWAAFAGATTTTAFCHGWLALQCRMIHGVRAGMVFLGPSGCGPFRPVADWPEGSRHLKHLTKTAERTLAERRGIVSSHQAAEG